MNVALLGGSFDPPHMGHLFASLYVLQATTIDEVWWVPCGEHPSGKNLTGYERRLGMCAQALHGMANIHISTVDQGHISYTAETVTRLQKLYPHFEFSWMLGSDIVKDLPDWHLWNELSKMLPFIVTIRSGYPCSYDSVQRVDLDLTEFNILPMEMPQISSSLIRERIRIGKSYTGLVPLLVYEYLMRHSRVYR